MPIRSLADGREAAWKNLMAPSGLEPLTSWSRLLILKNWILFPVGPDIRHEPREVIQYICVCDIFTLDICGLHIHLWQVESNMRNTTILRKYGMYALTYFTFAVQ